MDFGFPKELYGIQRQFIADAKTVVENGGVGVFSSPTGTGKTLSLLCTAMSFIQNDETDDLYSLLSRKSQTKVYYCSRTHSQLNQVIGELKTNRLNYKTVVLGSRSVLCINKKVDTAKMGIEAINDKCRDLQRSDGCEYRCKSIRGPEDLYYSNVSMDIEEMKAEGRSNKFCPYYYSKDRSEECEIVLLTYNLLFTKEGRLSADIDLEGKILIVDEAHNIHEAIIQLNSVELKWTEIRKILYSKGISKEIGRIIERLLEFYKREVGDRRCEPGTDRLPDKAYRICRFLKEARLADFNMLEIDEYILAHRIAQKNDLSSIFEFSRFLKLLTFSEDHSIVVFNHSTIKFTPLDPRLYFEELRKCRSILFAGGTMEPIEQIQQIFPCLKYFSYGTVNDRFLPLVVPETVNKKPILLTYSGRDGLIDDVVNTLVTITNPIDMGGIIVFVPSKQYLHMIRSSPKTVYFKRDVLFEDQSTFDQFKRAPNILVAVMGGKLSEGINFSDDLCRLLVIVGVPYPTKTTELDERTRFNPDYGTHIAMRLVNQTLGRAVRHRDDYSAMVLLDSRYLGLRPRLSPWILKQTAVAGCVEAMVKIKAFLTSQKQ